MENIFEGARFGDEFRTRDGKPAVYLSTEHYGSENDKDNPPFAIVYCAVEYHIKYADGGEKYFHNVERYDENGKWNKWNPEDDNLDIVGKWEEPIDEEKLADLELEAAEKLRAWYINHHKEIGIPMPSSFSLSDIDEAYMGGYDAGYRKAKEE